jgi:hypothetical protein
MLLDSLEEGPYCLRVSKEEGAAVEPRYFARRLKELDAEIYTVRETTFEAIELVLQRELE